MGKSSIFKITFMLFMLSLALAANTDRIHAEEACDSGPGVIENREGHLLFDDEDVWFQSRGSQRNDGTYSYEYCVKNTHPYTALFIEWEGHRSFMAHPDRAKPQAKTLTRYYNLTSSVDTPDYTEFRYGPTKNGKEEERVETVFEEAKIHEDLVVPIQFVLEENLGFSLRDALQNPEFMTQYREYLAQDVFGSEYSVDLVSFANVWVPTTFEAVEIVASGGQIDTDVEEYEVLMSAVTRLNPRSYDIRFDVFLTISEETFELALESETLGSLSIQGNVGEIASQAQGSEIYSVSFDVGKEMLEEQRQQVSIPSDAVVLDSGKPVQVSPGSITTLIGDAILLSLPTEVLVQ